VNDIKDPDFFQKTFPTIDKWDKRTVNSIYNKFKDTKIPYFAKIISYFADPRLWGVVGVVFTIIGFIEHDFSHLITFVSGFLQSFLLYYIIKNLMKRERPFKQIESIERLDKTGHGFSFPDHSNKLKVSNVWTKLVMDFLSQVVIVTIRLY